MSQILLAAYGTPLFDPTTIPGLKLWLKADGQSFSNNDPVDTWTDSSGNANDATQGTSGFRPVFKTNIVNGHSVVRFDGADDFLVASTPVPAPCSCFVVCVPRAAAGSQIQYAIYVITGGTWISTRLSTTNWGSFLFSSGEQSAGEVLTVDVPVLLEQTSTSSGPSTILYRSGVQKASNADDVASFGATNIQIGADDPASRWVNGDIAEVLLYDTVLSGFNRSLVEGYLSAYYAL